MRNESADVLRRVAAGETILVTNSGQPDGRDRPAARRVSVASGGAGQLREALDPAAILRTIKRRKSTRTTAEIID